MIDPELAQTIVPELQDMRNFVSKFRDQTTTLVNHLEKIILAQAQELSLFHLFEAHVDAGKVSEELWSDISTLLKQVRTAQS